MKPTYRSKLGRFRAVHSRGQFGPFPRSLQKGVFFLSARVTGLGIATWAVSANGYTGASGGVAFGAERVSRRISTYGVDVSLGVLKTWGIAPYADGFAESRSCLQAAIKKQLGRE